MEGFITSIVFVGIFILASGIRIINQYERGVILTLGKYTGMRNPGLNIIIPIVQTLRKVDVRSTPVDVPKQEVITKDNVTIGVDAVVYFRVLSAEKAVLETTNYTYATAQFAQAALRDVVGNVELDELLSKRDEISTQIKNVVDSETDKWGIDVENVKIQNIELPQDMKRAMAKQAEAERERRAVIITAGGEKAAAQEVAEAAKILSESPGGVAIRTLQTLEKISVEPSQKSVFVLPMEMTDALKKLVR
ncbi:slipin family protein [Candidatus Saccharibacteria bacterium]|nr:MAG: slipin family protein [Candidatus Saccharibacteria bacterium]TXG77440.1 MAG: slipin family protein [Patescibacteria group bacterium]